MTEIVDAFVATLGLDAREYEKEIRKYREDRKKLAEEEQKQNRVSQDGQSRTVAGLRTLRNETAGFLLMLAGASSVLGFAKDLLTADAATGRFARNIGMTTERVSVWENAIKRAGGTAEEARQALGTLFGIFQNWQLGIDNSKGGILALFGLSERDLKDPEAALMRISEAVKNMPREDVESRLALLGLSGSIVGLLAGDRGELTKLLASVEAAGVANDESAEAAMNLEDQLAAVSQGMRNMAREPITDLTNAFIKLTKMINNLMESKGVAMLNDLFGTGDVATIRSQDEIDAAKDTPEQRALREQFTSNFSPPSRGRSTFSVHGTDNRTVEEIFDRGGGRRRSGAGARPIPRTLANVESYFRGAGFSPEQVRGIAASVVAEGGLGARTGGGYKGRALGIGQLLGPRRAEFLRRYGKNFTFRNELDFMYEEMHNADGKFVGRKVKNMDDAAAIAKLMVDDFYRPAKGPQTWGDYVRAGNYLRTPVGAATGRVGASAPSQSNVTTVGAINVYTPATDATGIVRDIKGEMHRRGLVVQAGSGLRP